MFGFEFSLLDLFALLNLPFVAGWVKLNDSFEQPISPAEWLRECQPTNL